MSTHQPGTRILATVMFTDMVGYTALMQKDEKLAKVKRDRHREVLQAYHDQFEGRIIQYFGDGTVSIFTSALNALSCAIEIQRALKEPIEVPLRIGMHTGEILLEEDGIFGDAVNLASRIESFAIPDSILISDITHEAVKNQSSFSFVDMGLFSLKNVERPFRIFANANEGILVPKAEALSGKGKVFSAKATNLPKPLTKFFGRTNELEELTELVKSHRLITLTGPGGTGKTRTSIKVAEALSNFFSDGVQWIPLASVREVEIVPFEMAKALKLKEDPVRSMEEVLVDFIGDKSMLMVLDNFEQIVGAVSLIEELLAKCENLHIMVSSRICLNAEGEYEYKLPPLLLPSGNGNGSHTKEKLAAYPSVALFMDRASSYGKKIAANDQNLGIVSSICEKLDGLPLAIELAAARVKLFSVEELLPKLANPLDILKGNRKFADRHRTLRNTISWSYDLLTVEEKNLLSQLSIFVGGCNMESIQEVCEGIEDEFDLLDDLTVLIDNSLVVSIDAGGQQRFTLLELIKEFGLEQLEESQRLDSLKRNHIKYFTSLAQKGAKELSGPQDAEWSDQFYKELPNFRTAISYALELEEMQMAYDLGKALRVFLGAKGMVMEGINLLETITSKTVPENLYPEKLKVLQVLAFLYFYIPVPEKAIPIFEESYEYWKRKNDQENLGQILNDWGWANMMIRECAKCEEMSLEAKTIFEALSNKEKLENSCRNLGFSIMH
ncbi:MAG: adenylate/guanylate cyclase domain-containing protein, partial [Bacteroidota bacterium]